MWVLRNVILRVPAVLVGAFLVGVGLYGAFVSGRHAIREWRLVFGEGVTGTVPVVGYIPRTEVRRGGGNRSYEVTAHYHRVRVAGTEQEICLDEPKRPGTTIEVMYLPAVPSHVELPEDYDILGQFGLILILMLLFFLSFASFGLMMVMEDVGKLVHFIRERRPGERASSQEAPLEWRLWLSTAKVVLIASLLFISLGTANHSMGNPASARSILWLAAALPTIY